MIPVILLAATALGLYALGSFLNAWRQHRAGDWWRHFRDAWESQ